MKPQTSVKYLPVFRVAIPLFAPASCSSPTGVKSDISGLATSDYDSHRSGLALTDKPTEG